MATHKEEVLEIISRMPDDSTLDEIIAELRVREKVAQGRRDFEEGRVVTQDEMKRRAKEWEESYGQ
jgi:predicted transcriptional regulator